MAKEIDLRKCKPGDKLISCHGLELTYVKSLHEEDMFPHEVKYPYNNRYKGGYGTRCHNGNTWKSKRLDADHDIVKVIRGKRVMQSAKRIPITSETEYKLCVIEVI